MKYYYTILIFLLICSYPSLKAQDIETNPKRNIEIIIPTINSSIDCNKMKGNKELNFITKGNSINLKKGEYITLLMKPDYEENWIKLDNSFYIKTDYFSSWSFVVNEMIPRKCKQIILMAVVSSFEITEKSLSSERFLRRPDILCHSPQRYILRVE